MNKYYHCKTQEEYDWLMDKLDEEGYKWTTGWDMTDERAKSYWNYKKNNTVVNAGRNVSFGDIDSYRGSCNIIDFIDVGELMEKEREENMPTKNVDEFLKKKIFIKVSDDINIELQAGELKIQSQVRENWIKNVRRGLNLVNNILDYFESKGEHENHNS